MCTDTAFSTHLVMQLSRSYSFYDVIFDLQWESFVPLGVESCIWQAVEVASKATKNAS
jgi:hypothetical protein